MTLKSLLLFLLRPIDRARGMRKNDSAQVLLMTAFMAFTLAVFIVHSFNASQSVYRRIQVQHSADAAADAAAAWQSRGINMLNTLNNMHYVMNALLYIPFIRICCCCSEAIIMCAACVASLGFCGFCCDECVTCIDLCSQCSDYDEDQADMHKDFWNAEVGVIRLSTAQIYIQANQYAKANGATPFFRSAVTYVSNTAYRAISPEFPLHAFLKDTIKFSAPKPVGPPLQFERCNGTENIPGYLRLGALHAALIWGGSYNKIWEGIVGGSSFSVDNINAPAELLGFKVEEPSMFEFPWDLPEWFMTFCSLGQSDGWHDYYWKMIDTPTMTWASSISNQVGGVVRFLPQSPPNQPTSMFWYLNPGQAREVQLGPVIGLASSTSHGEIEATSIIPPSLGKAGAKGTLVPVKMQGVWFPKSALETGILH